MDRSRVIIPDVDDARKRLHLWLYCGTSAGTDPAPLLPSVDPYGPFPRDEEQEVLTRLDNGFVWAMIATVLTSGDKPFVD